MKKYNFKSKICVDCNKKYIPTGSGQKVCKKCGPYYKSDRCKFIKNQRRKTSIGRLEIIFGHLKERCENPNYRAYHRYGGRGIENKFKSCQEFKNYVLKQLKVDPSGLEIHRIKNDKHYEPGNIEFLTPQQHQKKHSKRVRTR